MLARVHAHTHAHTHTHTHTHRPDFTNHMTTPVETMHTFPQVSEFSPRDPNPWYTDMPLGLSGGGRGMVTLEEFCPTAGGGQTTPAGVHVAVRRPRR